MKSPKPALVQLVQKSPQLRLESPGCPGLEWNSSAMFFSFPPSPVFQEFIKMTNHDVEHAIKKRMSGDVRDAFVAIGQCSLRAGSPFSCHCQGSVAADSCCPWAMETPSGPWVGAPTESLERARPAPLYEGGLWLRQWCHSSLLCCVPWVPGTHFLSPLCVAVRSVKNKPAFFADKLYKSMKVRTDLPGVGLWERAGLGFFGTLL